MAHLSGNTTGGNTASPYLNPSVDGDSKITTPVKLVYRRLYKNYLLPDLSKDVPLEVPVGEKTPTPTGPSPPTDQLTRDEISKIRRERLDAAYYARLEEMDEAAIRNPNRKLRWNPNICPKDQEWLEQRQKFRKLLAAGSVASILEAEFEEAQKLLLVPSVQPGPMLQVQLDNTKEYTAFFEPGARFHGVKNNLATKLTMLKFGLPVEPVTLKNIERCGNPGDEDDPSDEPEEIPRVQRIMYAEKPLEFLDLYHERSFGYPMLRRAKLKYHQQPVVVAENSAMDGKGPVLNYFGDGPCPAPWTGQSSAFRRLARRNGHHRRPIFPGPSVMNIRGGAGPVEKCKADVQRFIYGNENRKVSVTDNISSFIDALFTLFPLEGYSDERDAYFFHIDIYNNQKKSKECLYYQRTIDIDQDNVEKKWRGSIRHPLFNYAHDWILRVQPRRTLKASTAPETFLVPVPGVQLTSKAKGLRQPRKGQNTVQLSVAKQKPSTSGSLPPHTLTDTPYEALRPMTVQPATTAKAARGIVYGYRGKLEAENTEESFLRAALLLTDQYPANTTNPNWMFDVDVPDANFGGKMALSMVPANWSTRFIKEVSHHLKADQPWQVFVRRGGNVSDALEPSESIMDIVRIHLDGCGTAYWKIPSDRNVLEDCGTNQIQPGFIKAMRLLCYDEPRRKENIYVHEFCLGVGGLECVEGDLWKWIKDHVKNAKAALKCDLTFRPIQSPRGGLDGDSLYAVIRMVGSRHHTTAGHGDWFGMAEGFRSMSEEWLCERRHPGSFRVWEDTHTREKNGRSAVIKYAPIEETVVGLKAFFGGWTTSNTIWFRPEWESFQLVDIDSPLHTTQWESFADQSLHSFRKALGSVWSNPESYSSFCITELQSVDGRDFKFIITKDTSEDEWRIHVYDWLHGNRLAVRSNVQADYVLDTANHWGVGHSLPQSSLPWPKAPAQPKTVVEKTISTTNVSTRQEPPLLVGHNLVRDDFSRPRHERAVHIASKSHTTTQKVPEFNRVRILKSTAGRVRIPKYATWMANEEYLDGLKQQSYVRDQQAVIPGKLPAAPVFGPSRELQIKVGSSLPTIYAHHLTATDFGELQDENQNLRNMVLERMWSCSICDQVFNNYDRDQIREHGREHINQIQESGQCPWCGNTNWAFMSSDKKRHHLKWHMAEESTTNMSDFWRQAQCPACDMSFATMKPEFIIDHCLKHSPDIVQYCDKCGLHEAKCINEELLHHRRVCREAPDRQQGDPLPTFCESCGKDTSSHTNLQKSLHSRDCQNGLTPVNRTFCAKCGLETSTFNNLELTGHASRCAVPRGITGKYCSRCATDLSELDVTGTSRHLQTCRPNKLAALTRDEESLAASKKADTLGRTQKEGRNEQAKEGLEREQTYAMDIDYGTEQFVERRKASEPQSGIQSFLRRCPIEGCQTVIGTMNGEDMFTHFKTHSGVSTPVVGSDLTTFECPLLDYRGEVCHQKLSLKNGGADMRFHYGHKGSPADQEAVQAAGRGEVLNDPLAKVVIMEPEAAETSAHPLKPPPQTHAQLLSYYLPRTYFTKYTPTTLSKKTPTLAPKEAGTPASAKARTPVPKKTPEPLSKRTPTTSAKVKGVPQSLKRSSRPRKAKGVQGTISAKAKKTITKVSFAFAKRPLNIAPVARTTDEAADEDCATTDDDLSSQKEILPAKEAEESIAMDKKRKQRDDEEDEKAGRSLTWPRKRNMASSSPTKKRQKEAKEEIGIKAEGASTRRVTRRVTRSLLATPIKPPEPTSQHGARIEQNKQPLH